MQREHHVQRPCSDRAKRMNHSVFNSSRPESMTQVLYQGQDWRVKQVPDYRIFGILGLNFIHFNLHEGFSGRESLGTGRVRSVRVNRRTKKDAGHLKAEKEENIPGENLKTLRSIYFQSQFWWPYELTQGWSRSLAGRHRIQTVCRNFLTVQWLKICFAMQGM